MIRWTPTGLRDLQSLHAYIAEDSQDAAATTVERINAALEAVQRFPEMGRKGRVAGTRELVVSPFVIAYRVKKDAIEVVAIIHGARRWPDKF
ncbi:MAG: type II toxin-antitoxin system RelE/ParE family toxin [Bryobacteraceae bacterium]|jgi:addiction module RelE/StbE family toxin